MFHLGLWAASWLVRAGLVRDLSPLAASMLAVKRRLSALGSDNGGMFVRIVGRDHGRITRTRTWNLIARSGDGPYVPAIASVILAKRLVASAARRRAPCPASGCSRSATSRSRSATSTSHAGSSAPDRG